MPNEERCANCRFWQHCQGVTDAVGDGDDPIPYGWCRRYPPSPITELSPDGLGKYPATAEYDWCGEYASRDVTKGETAMTVALSRWSAAAPTIPGWYWLKEPGHTVRCIHVYGDASYLVTTNGHVGEFDAGTLWCGPIRPPEKPT